MASTCVRIGTVIGVALVLVAAACTDADGGSVRPILTTVEIARATRAAETFDFRASVVEAEVGSVIVSEGVIDLVAEVAQYTADVAEATVTIRAIGHELFNAPDDGRRGGWVRAERDPDEGTWVASGLPYSGDPVQALRLLEDVERDLEATGEEEVDDVVVRCYTVDDADSDLADWKVCIDAAARLRRMSAQVDDDLWVVELVGFGAEVRIDPPPPGDVQDIDEPLVPPTRDPEAVGG